MRHQTIIQHKADLFITDKAFEKKIKTLDIFTLKIALKLSSDECYHCGPAKEALSRNNMCSCCYVLKYMLLLEWIRILIFKDLFLNDVMFFLIGFN